MFRQFWNHFDVVWSLLDKRLLFLQAVVVECNFGFGSMSFLFLSRFK